MSLGLGRAPGEPMRSTLSPHMPWKDAVSSWKSSNPCTQTLIVAWRIPKHENRRQVSIETRRFPIVQNTANCNFVDLFMCRHDTMNHFWWTGSPIDETYPSDRIGEWPLLPPSTQAGNWKPWHLQTMSSMFVMEDTSHPARSALNEIASLNMANMLFTIDTFHLERSALKADARKKTEFMTGTDDTSHDEMLALNEESRRNVTKKKWFRSCCESR